MEVFPRLVDEGLLCLEKGDVQGFQKLVDRNFDMRASIFELNDRDLELVLVGRTLGAAVKLSGSGGAVIGVMREAAEFAVLEAAYARAGYGILRPQVKPDPT